MKGLKKRAVLFFCVIVTALVFGNVSRVEAAHLNKYKKKLYVGESFQLKVIDKKGKVKFTSSNKKIATVNSKGLIRGKKRGSCTITAKVDGKKYKCKVTVTNMMDTNMTKARTLINLQRRDYGLPSLDYNKHLQAAAEKRAGELAKRYDHLRPNGKQFTSAISLKYNYCKYCYVII